MNNTIQTIIQILSVKAIWITVALGIVDTIIKIALKIDPVTTGSDILLGVLGIIFGVMAYGSFDTPDAPAPKPNYLVACGVITLIFWLISLYLISEDFINQLGFKLVKSMIREDGATLEGCKLLGSKHGLWLGEVCPGIQFLVNALLSLLCVFCVATFLQEALASKKR